MDIKNYYSVLNVEKEASRNDIKKAYHKMAMTYHPDVNGNKSGYEEKLKEINEAYDILGNEKKRMQYDRMMDLSNRSNLLFKSIFNNESNLFRDRFHRNGSMKQRYGCKGGGFRKGGCRRKQWK